MISYRRLISCLLLLPALALVIAACASQTATPAEKGPRLALEEESFNFGKVPLDKVVAHTFRLKNVGSESVVLSGRPQVRAAEGC